MRKRWLALCLIAVVSISGCQNMGGSDTPKQGVVHTDIGSKAGKEEQVKVKPVKDYNEIYKLISDKKDEMKLSSEYNICEDGILNSDVKSVDAVFEKTSSETSKEHGSTNVVTKGIDESDIIKNDGQYLYLAEQGYADTKKGIRIVKVDNKKMKEVSFIDIDEKQGVITGIYVDGTKLIAVMGDYVRENSSIQFYDIKERNHPVKERTVEVEGAILETRLANDYVYVVSVKNNTYRDIKNQDEYIPTVEGCKVPAECIYVPEHVNTLDFMVCQAISLKEEHKVKSSLSIMNSGDHFYMSEHNMYICDTSETNDSENTEIMRVSFQGGNLKMEAKGSVDGTITDAFSINEYKDNLRIVTQKEVYKPVEEEPETTGNLEKDMLVNEVIMAEPEDCDRTTQLSILNMDLKTVGKLENIAPDEQIHSVRFLGDTGYFVTFREIDPLFSVDLSNPEKPKILGELKVPGFSDYMHPYGDNQLLGIGYSVKENHSDCVKLSMFNTQDPKNVTEENVTELKQYESTDGTYDYRAICIDPEKNLFGLECESYGESYKRDYLVCSYSKEDGFKTAKTISIGDEEYRELRGTFVGDTFYTVDYGKQIIATDLQTMKQTAILKL